LDTVFPIILLLGRPASGKSEFLDYMQRQPPERLRSRYGLGRLAIVDDFPFLWEKFGEDDILERLGRPRIWSRLAEPSYTTTSPLIWPFLIEKINLAALKALESDARKSGEETLLIEFARGGPSGYRDALARLDPRILARAAILYIEVSFAESLRRNRARYDEARKGSILAHSVPEEAMHEVYATDDWPALTAGAEGHVVVGGLRVPYVTMNNEPESVDPVLLDARYHQALSALRGRA
jgi:hypothetical protein